MDVEGQLEGFWVESKSRMAFDLMYLTNKYKMLFVAFNDVNHQKQ